MSIQDTVVSDVATTPRVTATVENTSVADLHDVVFIVALFDPAGNAFAASQTALSSLKGRESREIFFTWPDPFRAAVGRVSITALSAPVLASQ